MCSPPGKLIRMILLLPTPWSNGIVISTVVNFIPIWWTGLPIVPLSSPHGTWQQKDWHHIQEDFPRPWKVSSQRHKYLYDDRQNKDTTVHLLKFILASRRLRSFTFACASKIFCRNWGGKMFCNNISSLCPKLCFKSDKLTLDFIFLANLGAT